jgi:YgiT-type zinc finger domain-containing protein
VPEVRLTREEMRMFKLKAGFMGGSTAALIRRAVESYTPQLQENVCCGEAMEVVKTDESFPFTVGNDKHMVTVKNIPVWRCRKCGEMEEDLMLIAAIEEVAAEEFENRLFNRETIPDEIVMDFNEMLHAGDPQTASV